MREKLRRTMEETRGLDVARAGEYTIGQWLEVWFSDYAALKVRPSSHQTYRGYLDHHIKPYIGGIPLTKLSSLDLQRLYKRLLSDEQETAQGPIGQDRPQYPSDHLLCAEAGRGTKAYRP